MRQAGGRHYPSPWTASGRREHPPALAWQLEAQLLGDKGRADPSKPRGTLPWRAHAPARSASKVRVARSHGLERACAGWLLLSSIRMTCGWERRLQRDVAKILSPGTPTCATSDSCVAFSILWHASFRRRASLGHEGGDWRTGAGQRHGCRPAGGAGAGGRRLSWAAARCVQSPPLSAGHQSSHLGPAPT